MTETSTITGLVRLRPVLDNSEHKFILSRSQIDVKGPSAPHVKWKWTKDSVVYVNHSVGTTDKLHTFPCARVFGPHDSTETIFEESVRPLVDSLLVRGTDACVCAYGQTNSGKTYTVFGTKESPGVLPRTVSHIFEHIDRMPSDAVALMRVSFFEVYNEQVRDLLRNNIPALVLQDHPDFPYTITNASEHIVQSLEDVMALLEVGEQRRMTGANDVHEHASRSHCIVRLVFETRGRSASLMIVDLAGSETNYLSLTDPSLVLEERRDQQQIANRIVATPERQRVIQARNTEGGNIRRSLLALIRCVTINAEGKGGRMGKHVPYRDSKLTRILRHALCGVCNTTLICTADPTEDKETLNTLRFATMAKKVMIKAQPKTANHDTLLDHYEEQMRAIEEELVVRGMQHREDLLDAQRAFVDERLGSLQQIDKAKQEKQQLAMQYETLRRCILTAGSGKVPIALPKAPRRRHSLPQPKMNPPPSVVKAALPAFHEQHKHLVSVILKREEDQAVQREENEKPFRIYRQELQSLEEGKVVLDEEIVKVEIIVSKKKEEVVAAIKTKEAKDAAQNVKLQLQNRLEEVKKLYIELGRMNESLHALAKRTGKGSMGCRKAPDLKEDAFMPSEASFVSRHKDILV